MKYPARTSKTSKLATVIFVAVFFGAVFTVAKALIAAAAAIVISGKNTSKLFDANISFWLLFILSYSIIVYLKGFGGDSVEFQLLFLPVAAYWIGKVAGTKCDSGVNVFILLLMMGFSLSFFTLLSVFLNIYEQGFSGLTRSIQIIGLGDIEASATVIGGNLVVLISAAGVLFCSSKDISPRWRLALLALVIAAVVVTLRIGSRTHLIILLISLAVGFLINRKKSGLLSTFVFIAGLISLPFVINYLLDTDSFLATYFMDRLDDDSYSAGSAGGRTERWTKSLELMIENPLGWNIDAIGFSHNFWLDTARAGGWVPFFFLCLHTLSGALTFYRAIECNRRSRIYVTTTSCLLAGFLLLFAVEPILDGFTYALSAYCGFLGVLSATAGYKSNGFQEFA